MLDISIQQLIFAGLVAVRNNAYQLFQLPVEKLKLLTFSAQDGARALSTDQPILYRTKGSSDVQGLYLVNQDFTAYFQPRGRVIV